MAANNEIPIEKVKEKAASLGVEILSRIHKDGRTLLRIKCCTHPEKGERIVDQHNFLYKTKTCGCAHLKKTLEEFKLTPGISSEVEVIGEYVNNSTKIKCQCRVCSNIWEATPNKLQQGRGCPVCKWEKISKKLIISQEEYESKVSQIDPTIEIISEYQGGKKPIRFYCKICGRISSSPANKVMIGESSCHYCNSSKGERRIILFLEENSIPYEREKRMEECRYRRSLSFDFYLEQYNLCIEYQGEQHYRPVDFSYTPTQEGKEKALKVFKQNQERDEIKREFCRSKGIKLLEISYKKLNKIEQILKNELNL